MAADLSPGERLLVVLGALALQPDSRPLRGERLLVVLGALALQPDSRPLRGERLWIVLGAPALQPDSRPLRGERSTVRGRAGEGSFPECPAHHEKGAFHVVKLLLPPRIQLLHSDPKRRFFFTRQNRSVSVTRACFHRAKPKRGSRYFPTFAAAKSFCNAAIFGSHDLY